MSEILDKKELKSALAEKTLDMIQLNERDYVEVHRAAKNMNQAYANLVHVLETLAEQIIDLHSMTEAREQRQHDPNPDNYKELTRIVKFIEKFANSPTV